MLFLFFQRKKHDARFVSCTTASRTFGEIQCLQDVYLGAAAYPRALSPVTVFLHGGAWSRGDKNHILHLHGNVGVTLARAGFVSLVMNYRLHPEASVQQQLEDVGQALSWVGANARRVSGSSAACLLRIRVCIS
jgi:acetyl esterase